MSQVITIVAPLTPAIVTTLTADINAINAIVNPMAIPITDSQNKGLLVVGTNRGSEIDAVFSGLIVPFPTTVPSTLTEAEFVALKQEQTDSKTLEGMCTALATFFGNHADIVGNNRMLMTVEVLDQARTLAKTNTAIAAALKEITTDHLTPSPQKGVTSYTIAAGGTMNITGVITGKMFINNGTTILTILVTGGNAAVTLTVNPSNGIKVPAKWTNITVTNLSASSIGSFQVVQK